MSAISAVSGGPQFTPALYPQIKKPEVVAEPPPSQIRQSSEVTGTFAPSQIESTREIRKVAATYSNEIVTPQRDMSLEAQENSAFSMNRIELMVKEANATYVANNTDIELSLEPSQRPVISFNSRSTGEMITQVPADAILEVNAPIERVKGSFVDKTA
jgi:uncharacterized FlaG/YvyC family protein